MCKFMRRMLSAMLAVILLCPSAMLTVHVQADEPDYAKEQEDRKALPIQSNNILNWPAGPEIGAQSAILMDIDTGIILYAKNIHDKLYPASTTKILTCLLAMENGNLDDMVKFSHEAVFSVPADGSNIGMDVGQSITLEECLYGIMVGSANEAANAAGEYISGSIDAFVDLMNRRAAELGCTESHFCNTNGLHDDNHYTSAHDLAVIASAFFQNEMLCKIGNTPRYHFEPTPTQPDDFYLNNKHQLITGDVKYEGIMGGKTGFTSLSRQTLVTACEQNGMRLVCVVMKEESPHQFTDTATLFDYGFSNFKRLNVADTETKYQIHTETFFNTDNDVFGNSEPFLLLDKNSSVIIPNNVSFDQVDSDIVYDSFDSPDNKIADISYSFNGAPLGSASLLTSPDAGSVYQFEFKISDSFFTSQTTEHEELGTVTTVFVNVKRILLVVIAAAAALLLFILLVSAIRNVHFAHSFNRRKKKKPLH